MNRKGSKRQVVPLYKFEKLPNIRGRGTEYKVTNNLTGETVYERTGDHRGKIREIGNELYFVDTKTRWMDEDSGDEAAVGQQGSSAPRESSASGTPKAATASTVKKTLIREFSPHQRYDILNEALYGEHSNKEGKTIDVAHRSKYGNVGPFYASICAVLNDGMSYPSFKLQKAVQSTVKSHVDDEVAAHKARLVSQYGEDFHRHDEFMVYDFGTSQTNDEDEELNDDFYNRQILMFLDALVFADVSDDKEPDAEPRHTEAQEKQLEEEKVDGKKRRRVEKVREKPINHVVQLQEQHNGLTSLINSIVSMTSEGPRPAAAESVDPGVIAIKNSLTNLPAPPGLPAVCHKLAEGLAGYGFCTLQELLTTRDSNYQSASAILAGLQWSPLQISRVLGDAPKAPG